ncbi:AP2-like ethylene-responsive transcription factor At1g16060 [Juglans microcarpa x Juglans regia]|uniref:AP2-like ethylene-responsive transcription factor At1g16060 n=1 Tax=Juglans microcarpa x Juglans regia TaxID=2249226 RepID=UPI001B7E3DBD|nr:AP2-like ethylene-responsive transcription factor At1g16060 [Juglans microcarpa x Juglans regia]
MAKLSLQNQRNNANISSTNNVNNDIKKVKRTRRSVPRDSPPQRSSIYRGVTRHRWTGRYEAHLWDKNCWNESQNKKGRQVYLGAYDDEDAAAHSYDLAALKYWGQETILNFPLSTYKKELHEMEGLSREEYIGSLRRKSSGFSRGVSKYRGVARHHHNGRWEARIGRVFGNKYLYLGTYATQEEAAAAYDMAAIEYRGLNAVTNFDLSRYIKWLKPDSTNNDLNDDLYNPCVDIINPNVDANTLTSNPNQELGLSFFMNNQQTYNLGDDQTSTLQLNQPKPAKSATSALGLLLQSSKFREMMEMTSMADYPSMPSDQSNFPQCTSFPEGIQTYFDQSHDHSGTIVFCEGDSNIFNDLNTLLPPIFHSDFDA